MSILLIDDEKTYPVDYIARTFDDGIEALKRQKWGLLLLDHDIGDFKDGKERTGYDILCWLEEHPEHLPDDILIISNNASAYNRMKLVIDKLYKKR